MRGAVGGEGDGNETKIGKDKHLWISLIGAASLWANSGISLIVLDDCRPADGGGRGEVVGARGVPRGRRV